MGESLEDRRLLSGSSSQLELFSVSPALFVENRGQWPDPSVRYAFFGSGANVLHTDAGPVIQFFQRKALQEATVTDAGEPNIDALRRFGDAENFITRSARVSVSFVAANMVSPVGLDRAETVSNFYVGDQAYWQTGVPTFEKVAYPNVYDGIDLVTYGRRDSLKYEFHIAPGADHRQIRISYEGILGLSLDEHGALHVQTALGELVDNAPYIYQEVAGRQRDCGGWLGRRLGDRPIGFCWLDKRRVRHELQRRE
jgi:hypothetical protein